jgi:hypothetical protein
MASGSWPTRNEGKTRAAERIQHTASKAGPQEEEPTLANADKFLLRSLLDASLHHVHNIVSDRIEHEIAHGVQLQFAHNI